MKSIHARTSLLVASTSALLWTAGGVILFFIVRTALTRQFDDGLSARASTLQSLTKFDGAKVEMDIAGEFLPRYKPGADAEFFTAWVRSGDGWQVFERSESLHAFSWKPADIPPPNAGIADVQLPDGESGRSLIVEFIPMTEQEGPDEHVASPSTAAPLVRLLVAQQRETLDRTLSTIALSILGVVLALILASVGAARWCIRRGTQSLSTLSASVAALGPDTLDHRLSSDALPAELAPIADRLNDLLARLNQAFAREKRFTGAASHELRTPIAELRMLLEVGLLQPRTPSQWEQSARDGLSVLHRAQRLTESLLRLSRASATAASSASFSDIAAILRDEAVRALAANKHDSSTLQIDAPPTLASQVDPALAASILSNLINNALRHGDLSHPIHCRAWADDSAVHVTVSNHAPTLSPSDALHLFEPFWRKDPSRDSRGGFGLGLAVSRTLAESIGGTLTSTLDDQHTLELTLRLPRPLSKK